MLRTCLLGLCLSLPLLAERAAAADPEFPVVLHGNSRDVQWTDDAFVVRSTQPLLQIQLGPGLVASMGEGTSLRFSPVARETGRYALRVDSGVVLVAIPGSPRVHALHEGYYPVTVSPDTAQTVVSRGLAMPSLSTPGMAQGFHLGDMVLTQQDRYLDSLRINVTTINTAVVSVINGLFGRR